jgi:hypothetical protein
MNPPTTMEIDLASDGENGALDSEDSGTSDQRRGYELSKDVLWIIFDCIGPGHYLYAALVCKKFCALYKEQCEQASSTYHEYWYPMTCHSAQCILSTCCSSTCTLYKNAGASVACATFAMNADYNLFRELDWRVFFISGAIRMNQPSVVKWMFRKGWFDYVTAEKCTKIGLVEVILWMWIHRFPFCAGYDPTIRKYFCRSGDIWYLDTLEIDDHYHRYNSHKADFTTKVYGRDNESYKHVLRHEFWDDDEYDYNFEVACKGYPLGFKLVYQRDTTNPPTTMEILPEDRV